MVQLHVFDAKLHCHDHDQGEGWSIPIRDIVLIAEFTTDQGPQCDDYFLEFVTREQDELFYSYVTMYASGIDDALAKLEAGLRCALELKLPASTEYRSRVVWPPQLAGAEYFRFEQAAPEGVWKRLTTRVKKDRQVTPHIADPIKDYLAGQIAPRAGQEPGVSAAN
ncbi:MAG TPA: hypothetical protein VKB38_17545 [Terracidiphilus sp.]|nr:hypothetical protein [Terracidiphilus sp.]